MLLRLCCFAALLASVSNAIEYEEWHIGWHDAYKYCRWEEVDPSEQECFFYDELWYTEVVSSIEECKESCESHFWQNYGNYGQGSQCMGITMRHWNNGYSSCYRWRTRCLPENKRKETPAAFDAIFVKQCYSDNDYYQGQGSIWCRDTSDEDTTFNCLWSGAARSSHECLSRGCEGDQCCYNSKDTAERQCNLYDSECKGFWQAPDGYWYVRGTGEVGGWIDNVSHPNAVFYMKYRDLFKFDPECERNPEQGNAVGCKGLGYWWSFPKETLENTPAAQKHCLDNNRWYPSLEAALDRCSHVAYCSRVMRWTDGRYFLRRRDDPEYSYSGVVNVKKGCKSDSNPGYSTSNWDWD